MAPTPDDITVAVAMDTTAESASDSDQALIGERDANRGTRFVRIAIGAAVVGAAVLGIAGHTPVVKRSERLDVSFEINGENAALMKLAEDKDSQKEVAVPVAELPANIEEAVQKAVPGGTIMSAELEYEDGKQVYEVTVKNGGKTFEVEVATDGTVIKKEEETPACFPGQAMVDVRARGLSPMKSLRIGDQVLVGTAASGFMYEPVLSFLHITGSGSSARHLIIQHASGRLRVSAKHVVFVSTKDEHSNRLADALQVGDQLLLPLSSGLFESSPIVSIQHQVGIMGMYAPLTSTGTLVVDGVLASNYAGVPLHGAIHAAMFLARMYSKLGLEGFTSPVFSTAPSHPGQGAEVMHVLAKFLQSLQLDRFVKVS